MENIKVYVESGQVFILSGSSAITGLNTSLSTAPQPVKFPANGELTASVVNTNNIKVVTSTGQIVLNDVPFGNLKEKNGTTAIGASATAVRDNLNSTHIFSSATLETKLGVETAKITALENATKTATNDRGIYINDAKGLTQGHLQLTDTLANLQAGATTAWNLTDISTGQGSIVAKVRAGSNGNQTSVTAMTIAGSSSLNNTLTTFHQPVTFSSSVTGIDLADLDNVILGSASDGDVLTWDNTNSYWKPVAPGTLSLTSLLTDVFSAQGLALSAVDAGADKFVMWDDSDGKLTYFTPGSAFSIQGTSINVRNLSNSDMTVSSGTRTVGLSTNGTTFRIMTGQGTPFSIENDGGNAGLIRFNGDVRFDSGALSGGILKLEENPQGGSNFVALQAPSSLSADLTLKLPATDGSAGQFLKTDGSGNLSFASAGSGGGMTETPFVAMSGRATFSASDEEERVLIGTSYGWSFYSQSTEMGAWSSSDAVNSTTYSLAAYIRAQAALHMPSDEKKVRMKVSYRVQNGASTDFGFSIWSGDLSHNSTANANVTLRGASATQTVGTSSITSYKKEFTTTSTITDDAVFVTIEQRGGASGLSTTAYVYYNIHLFLVD